MINTFLAWRYTFDLKRKLKEFIHYSLDNITRTSKICVIYTYLSTQFMVERMNAA